MKNIEKAIKDRINGIGIATIVTAAMLIAVSLWHQQNPLITFEIAMAIVAGIAIPTWIVGMHGFLDHGRIKVFQATPDRPYEVYQYVRED